MLNARALRALLAAAMLLAGTEVLADWTLDSGASTLGFVSVKNGSTAEGHRFRSIEGRLDDRGAELIVDLASVDTRIEIRDERMRKMLFEVVRFPHAVFRAGVSPAIAEELAVGASTEQEVVGTLAVQGIEVPLTATVLVTRSAPNRLRVASARPVIVSTSALELDQGLEQLRKVAGLDGITPEVPVSFSLSFRRD